MRLQQFQNNYLYEGLDRSATQTMMLWESAGFKLKEAALTADQIQQIFQNVEQGATAAGDNRTILGKGKDAAAAVNKAWEDLKTKVQNSGPIKNVDAAYDSAVAKIETGLGGPDNAINKVIQRYRKFAKEHPIAQGLIYSALIAAAGISGAGLGGAAVLGLLKMADKLLQGEKFSSAAYSGAKTGAMAYGASKIGDMIKGKPEGGVGGGEMSPDMQQGLAADQAFQDRILNKFPPDKGYTFDSAGKSLQVFDANGTKVFTSDIPLKTMDVKTFADLTNNGQMATPGISSGSISSDAMAGVSDKAANVASAAGEVVKGSGVEMFPGLATDQMANNAIKRIADKIAAGAMTDSDLTFLDSTKQFVAAQISDQGYQTAPKELWDHYNVLEKMVNKAVEIPKLKESRARYIDKDIASVQHKGKALSEGQVYMIFNRVCARNDQWLSEGKLIEGPMDWIKDKAGQAAGAVAGKAKQIGKNLTTKVTADKLNSAWQKAGSPMDSEEVAAILKQAGVGDDVVGKVYTDLKLPAPGAAPAAGAEEKSAAAQATAGGYAEIKKSIMQLNTKDKKRMIAYLTKQLGTA